MKTFIRNAFIKKEHVVAVFFDLEKAYDTTWRYGILKDIHKLGLRGRLPLVQEPVIGLIKWLRPKLLKVCSYVEK